MLMILILSSNSLIREVNTTFTSIAQMSQAWLGNLTAFSNLFWMKKPECIQENNLKQAHQ